MRCPRTVSRSPCTASILPHSPPPLHLDTHLDTQRFSTNAYATPTTLYVGWETHDRETLQRQCVVAHSTGTNRSYSPRASDCRAMRRIASCLVLLAGRRLTSNVSANVPADTSALASSAACWRSRFLFRFSGLCIGINVPHDNAHANADAHANANANAHFNARESAGR
jgi:hypothetical protein